MVEITKMRLLIGLFLTSVALVHTRVSSTGNFVFNNIQNFLSNSYVIVTKTSSSHKIKEGNEYLTSSIWIKTFLYRHTLFYYTLIDWILRLLHCFYKLKVCGNPVVSNSTVTIFPTAFSSVLSQNGHILVILAIFQTLSLYFLWKSVISDHFYIVIARNITNWRLI